MSTLAVSAAVDYSPLRLPVPHWSGFPLILPTASYVFPHTPELIAMTHDLLQLLAPGPFLNLLWSCSSSLACVFFFLLPRHNGASWTIEINLFFRQRLVWPKRQLHPNLYGFRDMSGFFLFFTMNSQSMESGRKSFPAL